MLGQRFYYMLGQRLYNMLGQRLYNILGQRLYNMLGQRLYNMFGQRFLDEQSDDGFASRNQIWPNENCGLRPNVGPTSTCYLGRNTPPQKNWKFTKRSDAKHSHYLVIVVLLQLCVAITPLNPPLPHPARM